MTIFNDPALLNQRMKTIFGYDKFNQSEQEDATNAVLRGDRDVYIDFVPGGGKSLCYQLPTLLKERSVTVVFVPTNMLAKDQIEALKERSIEAEYLCPRMPKDRRKALLDSLGTDKMKCRFLYVSNNKSTRDLVKEVLMKLNYVNAMAYMVFDEAHCISKLSHDYIPAYDDVTQLMKNVCPNIPKIALTGTATAEVKRDIIQKLGMKTPREFNSHSYYPYVLHDVQFMDVITDKIDHLRNFIQKATESEPEKFVGEPPKCGIIFCRKKQTAEAIANHLSDIDIQVVAYHGDLPLTKRISIHERWIAEEIQIIATTRQFGIGLRRRDVKFVVHWGMPMSIPQLVQETGRANQDGRRAYCRLYFSCEEEMDIITEIKSMLKKSPNEIDLVEQKLRFFQELIDYCFQTTCRLVAQWYYFGGKVPACERSCDACRNKNAQRRRVNKFRDYRASLKSAMTDSLAVQKYQKQDLIDSGTQIVETYEEYAEEILNHKFLRRQLREHSYCMLRKELKRNYSYGAHDVGQKLKNEDICEIARQLEYSTYIGTQLFNKYLYTIRQKIQIIRRCTDSYLACGYIIFNQTQPLKNPEIKNGFITVVNLDRKRCLDEDYSKTSATANIHVKPSDGVPIQNLVHEGPKLKKRRIDETTKTRANASTLAGLNDVKLKKDSADTIPKSNERRVDKHTKTFAGPNDVKLKKDSADTIPKSNERRVDKHTKTLAGPNDVKLKKDSVNNVPKSSERRIDKRTKAASTPNIPLNTKSQTTFVDLTIDSESETD